MARRGRYPAEVRERAVRMVFEHEREYESQWVAITSIAGKLGMTNETLRKWVRQAEVDGGARPGVSSVEAERVRELGVLAAPTIGGTPVVLALDVADAEAAFAQAVAAGAQVRQPLADTFWGDLHGQLDDPFGLRWNLRQHLRDVPHDEIVAAAARAFA
jgi:transposase